MIELKRKLKMRLADESGFSIIEVLVALIVFSVMAVGIAYTLTNTLVLTNEARSREVAIHLAAQEVDKIRSLENIFDVISSSETYTVDGIDYTVDRRPYWDNSAGDAIQCGNMASGSGLMEFKRVEIEIDWPGRRAGSQPVYTDTVVSPDGRINLPTLGTILVSVNNAAGAGAKNIAVSATATSGGGGETPTDPIPLTDSEGCSYILKVEPGEYELKVSKANYVDVDQNVGSASRIMSIAAGELKSVQFQFDEAANFIIDYASNYPNPLVLPVPPKAILPGSTPVTAVSTYGIVSETGSPLKLHPFSSGYELFAGNYSLPSVDMGTGGCLSPDPSQWDAGPGYPPTGGSLNAGVRGGIFTAAPGQSVNVPVEMGVVRIALGSNKQVKAVSRPTAPGTADPGCQTSYTLNFPNINGTKDIALPFGTWQIQVKATSGWNPPWVALTGSGTDKIVEVRTLGQIMGNTVLVDPRKAP